MASTDFTNSTTLTDAGWFDDVDTLVYGALTSVAGTNTITATGPASLTGYSNGQVFRFIPANTNSGATTLNISSLGAKNIYLNGLALAGGELKANVPVIVVYDGTRFHLSGNGSAVMQRHIPKYISGLTYSNSAGDATNDIDIAAGAATDSTGAYSLVLSSTLTKQLDAAWAVGTNAGGLDTGSIGNNDYYIWLIARSDTGVVDALFSTSSTSPTMPANYDYKRLIGWFKRVGGAVAAFHTYETEGGGLEYKWDAPSLDVDLTSTLTTARRTDPLSVPRNFSTTAHIRHVVYDGSATFNAIICCPDETDAAPSASAAPGLSMIQATTTAADGSVVGEMFVRTSATGTIAARADLATVDVYRIVTVGFRWARRN